MSPRIPASTGATVVRRGAKDTSWFTVRQTTDEGSHDDPGGDGRAGQYSEASVPERFEAQAQPSDLEVR